jgi:hypothetical protein
LRKSIAISAIGSLAIGLLFVLVAGCGGSDDSSDSEEIDKATFIAQADKICEQSSGKMAAGLAAITKREQAKPNYDFTETQITVVRQSIVPGLEEELQKIRALGVPVEKKKEAEAFLRSYSRAIALMKAKPEKVVAFGGIAPNEAVALAATRMGVKECPITSFE